MQIPTTMAWLDSPADDRGIFLLPGRATSMAEPEFTSYLTIAQRAGAVCGNLFDLGVPNDACVLVMVAGGPGLIAAFYGVQSAGAVPSVMPPPPVIGPVAQHEQALRRSVSALNAALVVVDRGHCDYAVQALGPAGTRVVALDDLLQGRPARRAASETALIQFTSGTRGEPRAVRIGHATLDNNVAAIRQWEGAGPLDAWASWLPMHHDMGLIGCMVVPVTGMNSVWLTSPQAFIQNPLPYLRTFGCGDATISAMPAFGLDRIVAKVDEEALQDMDLSGWRMVIVGAERIDPRTVRRFTALLAPRGLSQTAVTPAYGLAESTLAVTGGLAGDCWRQLRLRRAALRPGCAVEVIEDESSDAVGVVSCGQPLNGLRVDIEHPVEKSPLAEGYLGEIVVRGTSVAQGYLYDDGDRLRNGILRTGDMGFLHEGQLYVLGRAGDSVKIRGGSVFAEDLELALRDHGIAAHRICVVLGTSDYGPVALAFLEAPDATEIQAVRDVLRGGSWGGRSEVIALDRGQIPRTTSGKQRRYQLWHAWNEQHQSLAVSPQASREESQ